MEAPCIRGRTRNETSSGAGLTVGPVFRRALLFYTGLHHPSDAKHFERCCISIHSLINRRKPIECDDVLVDSGAFTKLEKHGEYPEPVEVYARQLYRLWTQGIVRVSVATTQDYMCEPFMLAKTGLTVLDHQRMTIERYDALVAALETLFGGPCPFPVMPVLQGFTTEDYLRHIDMWGERLTPGMWVGVGSVCKRQGDAGVIADLLLWIHYRRPDLRLHGFGVKLTALKHPVVCDLLHSADSLAWSYAARKVAARMVGALGKRFGRKKLKTAVARRYYRRRGVRLPNANDWREAKAFEARALQLAA